MITLRRLFRAEYRSQPAQLARRLWRLARLSPECRRVVVDLSWRLPIAINPHDLIGRSILTLNTLDLPVTEALWRLLDAGEVCADIGANIGYMTSVMAARLRTGGTVLAFEPMPELADALCENVHIWRPLTRATLTVARMAVGSHNGPGTLYIPHAFDHNRGLASMIQPPATPAGDFSAPRPVSVSCVRLDDIIDPAMPPALIKVDVEGFEQEVFRGAENLLGTRRIRDVIFEESRPFEAPSLALLRTHGYTVFRVTREWNGPGLRSPDSQPSGELDPPTYLATHDPMRARVRFARRGWLSLYGG